MTSQEAYHLIKGVIMKPAFPSMFVSGGQTGADRAALDFALTYNLGLAGYCSRGRKAEDGEIPDFYQLEETPSNDDLEHTRLNVEMADATVIFQASNYVSRGLQTTLRHAQRVGQPYVICSHFPDVRLDANDLSAFLTVQNPLVLNVAGSPESSRPGMHAHVKAVLAVVAEDLKHRSKKHAVSETLWT
jgi:hypothetical protein